MKPRKCLCKTLEDKNLDAQELEQIAQAGNLTRIEIISQDGKVLAESEKYLSQPNKRRNSKKHFVLYAKIN